MGPRFTPLEGTLAAAPTDSGSVFGLYGADQLPDTVSGLGKGAGWCSWRGTQEDNP